MDRGTSKKFKNAKMLVIRGVPGSGKSTLAKIMASQLNAEHFEADMFFMQDGQYKFDFSLLPNAHRWCQNSVDKALSLNQPVIVSNTFTTFKEIKPYLDICKKHSIVPCVIAMQIS